MTCPETSPTENSLLTTNSGFSTSNFGGLVLGCMDSYDSEERSIFQHFSKSTRVDKSSIPLHRSKFKCSAQFCQGFSERIVKKEAINFSRNSSFSMPISMIFLGFFAFFQATLSKALEKCINVQNFLKFDRHFDILPGNVAVFW